MHPPFATPSLVAILFLVIIPVLIVTLYFAVTKPSYGQAFANLLVAPRLLLILMQDILAFL